MLTDLNFRLSYGPGDDRLSAFYIPALAASIRYDRMTGYFSSYSLAIAAAGVAHLIANGGRMRLLVGAQLSREDVEAIEAGYDLAEVVAARMGSGLPDPAALTDQLLRERLAALAWLIAQERLEIRVVLPKGPNGLPLPAPDSREYFHPKVGIFTDAEGNQVAFNGSINESENAWEHNYEYFTVWRSWFSDESCAYVGEQIGRFERLWEHREPDWISLPVPEAARQSLLRYAPASAPTHDPLKERHQGVKELSQQLLLASALERERVLCQFLRDAPFLIGGGGLGAATAAVEPWPHQTAVAQQVVGTFPARYLLCDEVGLGKTIEAGLVLRTLWLRGHVKRALILAPKSVLRQWQEELYEKFALNVPLYTGKDFVDYWGVTLPPTAANPWDGARLALASSQLLKRRDRQAELLNAAAWDLVLVDEAHHARRKDFLDQTAYRPNRLLELLRGLRARTQGLLLMTATPMQVDPIEVWDLLELLGLSGEWGADGREFLRFYTEMRKPEPDWQFIFHMAQAEQQLSRRQPDATWERKAKRLGAVERLQLHQVLEAKEPEAAATKFALLTLQARALAETWLKEATPLRRLVFRNTRPLLREYVQRGLLHENVATRRPYPVWIDMREEEHELYLRIEEYISSFYRKYEAKRKGLGFVMTVYRRRLTSSFYAVRRSLERRLAFLRGQTGDFWDDDDLEQDALALDLDEELPTTHDADYQEEIAYVEDFLNALGTLSSHDSKIEQLQRDLETAFRRRDTALVFTQYTDTLDFLRDQLRQLYGSQVACYSGRGGEWWDGNAWVPITKEVLKQDFRQGERIKILLATEAASEGLNLQTCGVLINYDMPWNPMRVEQRIGRVDRIGQRYKQVWIYNYFYTDTVEANVYKALNARIDWFEDVVGPLQPILAQVGRAIQRASLASAAERAQVLEHELEDIEAALDGIETQLNLDAWAAQAEAGTAWPTPVTLAEMGAFVLESPTLQAFFRPHETLEGAYWLNLDGQERAVTFERRLFDEHPNTLQLLTYGNPLWEQLLSTISAPEGIEQPRGAVLRVAVETPLPRVAYYALAENAPRQLDTMQALYQALQSNATPDWTTTHLEAAQNAAQARVESEWAQIRAGQAQLREARHAALLAQARRLLLDATLIELALGQQLSLLDSSGYPLSFDVQAIVGLRRHGYPWAGLVLLLQQQAALNKPQPTDPFFVRIQGNPPEQLKRQFESLAQKAKQLLKELAAER